MVDARQRGRSERRALVVMNDWPWRNFRRLCACVCTFVMSARSSYLFVSPLPCHPTLAVSPSPTCDDDGGALPSSRPHAPSRPLHTRRRRLTLAHLVPPHAPLPARRPNPIPPHATTTPMASRPRLVLTHPQDGDTSTTRMLWPPSRDGDDGGPSETVGEPCRRDG